MSGRRPASLALLLTAALPLVLSSGCADREGADDLLDRIEGDAFRTTYARAPGWETPRSPKAGGPHGDFLDIYVNETMSAAIAAGEPLDAWPVGSIIVKESWASVDAEEPDFLVAMERQAEGWFWGEWEADGSVVVAGLNSGRCTGCHDAGEDQVRAFGLPPI
ncbi:MAG: cytochrome P460 family protein [Myxococcales bacterium]|nr:cytochrome P460 family protein [Myxococcales bacterium]MCB9570389.1 cytochrome P460 family protein [Myxococcales bacterium]MCB9701293.1 cytochrome P460 family protein [Myxococcales bacterium]